MTVQEALMLSYNTKRVNFRSTDCPQSQYMVILLYSASFNPLTADPDYTSYARIAKLFCKNWISHLCPRSRKCWTWSVLHGTAISQHIYISELNDKQIGQFESWQVWQNHSQFAGSERDEVTSCSFLHVYIFGRVALFLVTSVQIDIGNLFLDTWNHIATSPFQ
jgi:hypothetical protein